MFDDLRKRIERKSVDAAYLLRSDTRSLAVALVDTIMWANYERVMDTLQVQLQLSHQSACHSFIQWGDC